jgi:NagD protein
VVSSVAVASMPCLLRMAARRAGVGAAGHRADVTSGTRPAFIGSLLRCNPIATAAGQPCDVLTEREPDYVVVGETRAYSQQAITRAIRLIASGARFIATNPDPTGPSPAGPQPATGAVAALISKATGVRPYFVGKPNPLMMREALRAIDAHSESTVMIGDRMDTDIVAGIEAGLQTILVLTGITGRDEAQRFPFLPSRIVDSVADLVDDVADRRPGDRAQPGVTSPES